MISRLKGTLDHVGNDHVVVDVNGVGYEVWVPQFTLRSLSANGADPITLYTYQYFEGGGGSHLIPRLTGFVNELDREFFLQLTRVQDMGPRKALQAMAIPTNRLARAILDGDLGALKKIKGVGPKMAAKIVATLSGAMGKFALMPEDEAPEPVVEEDIGQEAQAILVSQLGYRESEAKSLVRQALDDEPKIATTDELLTAVFKRIGGR